jgi:hypothetical protein
MEVWKSRWVWSSYMDEWYIFLFLNKNNNLKKKYKYMYKKVIDMKDNLNVA